VAFTAKESRLNPRHEVGG